MTAQSIPAVTRETPVVNYVGKIQRSPILAPSVDAVVEQRAADNSGPTARSTPVAQNSPALAGLRQTIRGHGNAIADAAFQRPGLLDPPTELTTFIASKLDLDAGQAVYKTRETNMIVIYKWTIYTHGMD